MPSGSGPRHLAFHPTDPFVYVIGELDSTVTVLRRSPRAWRTVQTLSTLPTGFAGPNLGAEIAVAPSGRFVYASNRGHDSLATYVVDAETGRLTLAGHTPTLGVCPRHFVIDSSGALLLVANQDSDTVVSFWIDPPDGALRPTGQIAQVKTPVCLQLA
jgi:6-phosphogluconolactonase